MTLLEETKFIMQKYNTYANKNFGQNFLIDENVIEKIISSADVNQEDLIIEIGPGLGSLTSALLEKAGKVICIEIDEKMIRILNDRFSLYKNYELINQDVLKVNLNELISKNSDFKKVKIVANLPYYITTPIILKLLEQNSTFESITVMVQKEVALRYTSLPGNKEIGSITHLINYYSNPEIVLDVPKECFMPAPKVDSAVLKLNILNEPKVNVKDVNFFFKVVKFSFLQKRKTLVNSLSNSKIINKNDLEAILTNLNIDIKSRPEDLTIEDYAKLTDEIINKNSKN